MPKIATITTAPTTIQSHGIVLVVVVVVVVPSVVVDLSTVEPAGAVTVVEPPAAGPLLVVVVELVFDVPVVCANVIAGAMARNKARRMKLSRKIGRIGFSSVDSRFRIHAQENPT
jgi:hypothetical protein